MTSATMAQLSQQHLQRVQQRRPRRRKGLGEPHQISRLAPVDEQTRLLEEMADRLRLAIGLLTERRPGAEQDPGRMTATSGRMQTRRPVTGPSKSRRASETESSVESNPLM
jgi:hypothetical protein